MRQQDQCKVEIVRHKPTLTEASKRKPSSEGKRTEASSKIRENIKIREGSYTPSLSSERYKDPQMQQSSCLNTIFHKEKEYQDFAEKCFNYLSRKKLGESQARPNTFCTMLQNIKKSIKQSERREKEEKEEPMQQRGDLMCVRSQIHQIYNNNDQKMELYKMIKSNEPRPRANSNRDSATLEPGARYVLNPFLHNRTIVCFTMALNQPQVQKKPLFEAPVYRPTTTSVGKRVVAITKATQPRAMCFQLSGDGDGQYTKKLKNYLDFLFKINYSNNIYIPFQLAKYEQSTPKYKAYVGRGNNSLLVKSLIKRRFWWEVVEQPPDTAANIDFYWSQNIVDHVHASQEVSQRITDREEKNPRRKQQDEAVDLNRKILSIEKCHTVERFISKEGYVVPFEAYSPDLISNHLPRNYCIGSKKNLFRSLSHFLTRRKKDPFEFIPRTYHLRSIDSPEYRQFIRENQNEPERVWIVKPGENTNRGNGITLSTFSSIQGKLRRAKHENGQPLTYIVQSYINRPFLYAGRKFDIRHYLLLTSVNGLLKAYWYRDGYIRTSSQMFDLQDLDNPFVHLTNDAIQRKSEDYQKYEPANKLSYSEFQRYLDYSYPGRNYSLERDVLPRMKELATYVVRANCSTIDHRRHRNNFQIFGLDFMIDRDFKTWLIEVNYNPCLEVNCPVLERIIPAMVENSLRVGLDPLYPPNAHYPPSRRYSLSDYYLRNLRYELIFDEEASNSPDFDYGFVEEREQEEQYQDEGKEVDELLL